ncbi:LytS/YhcK type 5TM receptor domain-containing protein [Bacillus pacificus]|uniref:histidine kinase n=7 Tax=Bacillus pacificus TaxID=2026187 RepID=A0ABX6I0K8_9BACI|nr:HAMP domain-containing sensor histidine kinase [Bacillus pacificus]MBL3792425.1 HAMP domain-containing histidine kinase [Bacillus cereus]MBL3856823.1 HAMP domain-containing histidine kinase [Bacillus cereus]MCU5068058.1 HAMP domain-containing histidine kinase [Bacillus pacificus]MCU5370914.1 HAMP domain-containing histidine kinase [Bacillus pacificus]QHH88315.1 HAMP domain-containing histidine kinase [Bacillus pacificus]
MYNIYEMEIQNNGANIMNFVYINQNVLNNLLYILISIFIFYFIYDSGRYLKKYKTLLITLCSSIPLILCMRYPIYMDESCIHDLRQIPVIIGTLYGGFPVGIILFTILLITRFLFYGFNMLTVIVYGIMFIITAFASAKFNTYNRKIKVAFSMFLTFFLAIFTTVIVLTLSNFEVNNLYIIYFIILPTTLMLFIVYINEVIKDAVCMRSKLIKMEKMEIVSQLAASISHEVRNPLTVVKGFTQLLKTSNLTPESRDKYIDHILEELNRAQEIIDDYLTFAKPAPEKLDHISVEQELNRVINMIVPLCNMNTVHITKDFSNATIVGNKQHFQQCFLNLIKNGIEAMPNGGTLNISSSISNNKVIIRIEDSGIGMSQEQINRFGEPYFSTKTKGTGLGTMVAVKIIETMQGNLKIRSVMNKGTTLTITFPKCNTNASNNK